MMLARERIADLRSRADRERRDPRPTLAATRRVARSYRLQYGLWLHGRRRSS
jgi:hypothetical protein